MSDDRTLPVPIASSATWMRVAETKQRQIDDLNQQLARYCQTINTQRALINDASKMLIERDRALAEIVRYIADLERERDALRAERDQRISWAAGQTDCTREQAERALFPSTALRSGPWTPVV